MTINTTKFTWTLNLNYIRQNLNEIPLRSSISLYIFTRTNVLLLNHPTISHTLYSFIFQFQLLWNILKTLSYFLFNASPSLCFLLYFIFIIGHIKKRRKYNIFFIKKKQEIYIFIIMSCHFSLLIFLLDLLWSNSISSLFHFYIT